MSDSRKLLSYSVLSLISPFITLILAIRSLTWKQKKPIFMLLSVLFGGTIFLATSDGYELKKLVFEHYVGLSFDQWLFEFGEIIRFSPEPGTKGDVFSHVSSYLIGHILGFPDQYFIFVSIVYSYFYVSAMEKILNRKNFTEKNVLFWFIVVLFVTYRFVDSMQTVRTWTGAWVLFNGVYGFYETKKLKYVFLMLLAPMFHFAYFGMAMPAYIALFVRRFDPRIFILIYVASFFTSINPGGIVQQMEQTDLGESKVKGYYNEEERVSSEGLAKKSGNFYRKYGHGWALKESPHYLALALIIIGLYRRDRMNGLEIGLFTTGILMATTANFGNFISAFYNRTMINAGIYILATTVLLMMRDMLPTSKKHHGNRFKKIILWAACLTYVPYLIYTAANMISFSSASMLVFAPLGFFETYNLSIRQLIGILFLGEK